MRRILLILALSGAALSAEPRSTEPAPYSPLLAAGEACEVPLELLHPTQFCVGAYEIRERAAKISELKPRKARAYFQERIVPLVIGPGGVPYLIDRHHLACAALKAGTRKALPAKILENWRELGPEEFWARMKSRGWVYLFNQGAGPLDPETLPRRLDGMTDDPFRSLVWAAREIDPQLDREPVPYVDFRWADEFRKKMDVPADDAAMRDAAKVAAEWMRTKNTPAEKRSGDTNSLEDPE